MGYPSIHPSPLPLLLISVVAAAFAGKTRFSSPSRFIRGILRQAQARQDRYSLTPECCRGLSLRRLPGRTCLEHLIREASWRHPHQALLTAEVQWLYSEPLPDDRASHPLSKAPMPLSGEQVRVFLKAVNNIILEYWSQLVK